MRAHTFGKAARKLWPLDPEISYLNHGTVGVTPIAVLEAQNAIRLEIESNPSAELLRKVTGMIGKKQRTKLREAAARVAPFVGVQEEDLAFVGNATEGVNGVLRSFGLEEGDAVLTTEKTYGGVKQAVRYACREAGANVQVATLPCPITSSADVLAAIEKALTARTRLAVLDHIVSETGVVLPIKEMVALCHSRGARVLVDGAHAPGQLELDIPSVGADYYTANMHKWALAPRSCGILWANPEVQGEIHPPVISWPLDEGFANEFDWTGTRDTSAWLAAPAGIEFLDRLGFDALRAYNHDLVWRGARMLMERWNVTSVAGEDMSAFMATTQLPESFEATESEADRIRDALLFEHRIEVPIFAWHDRLWMRLSAQVYNEFEEFERLAEAVESEAP